MKPSVLADQSEEVTKLAGRVTNHGCNAEDFWYWLMGVATCDCPLGKLHSRKAAARPHQQQ